MTVHRPIRRAPALASGLLALGALLGLTGCANFAHKSELQTAARDALVAADLTAGAEAFDTGEGFADRYDLLVCAAVPPGREYDDRARAQVVVDVLNAVREVALGQEDRVDSVSIRLTDESTEQDALNNWCRGDTRRLGLRGVDDFVSVPADRADWDSAEFTVPYPEAQLQLP